jgi:anti-sigma B factor antagonist
MSEKHASHWLEREDIGDITVVRFKTPKVMDEETIRVVFEQIYAVCDAGRSKLVVNLAVTNLLPSMALGKLVMLNRKVEAAKGRLALCRLSQYAEETLTITRLLPLFNVYGTEQSALQSFC